MYAHIQICIYTFLQVYTSVGKGHKGQKNLHVDKKIYMCIAASEKDTKDKFFTCGQIFLHVYTSVGKGHQARLKSCKRLAQFRALSRCVPRSLALVSVQFSNGNRICRARPAESALEDGLADFCFKSKKKIKQKKFAQVWSTGVGLFCESQEA